MNTAQGASKTNNMDVTTKRKLIPSQSEVDFKPNVATIVDKPKENDKASATSKTFLYEPPMVSAKVIRAWELETGSKYYDLSPSSRR